ncbi:TPA: hypothetical protein ACH3X3_006137 [Trebouxia sp. C0006]
MVYPVDEQALQLLTKSSLSEGHLRCLSAILESGNPEQDPCIDSNDAIMLDGLLNENGIKGGCVRMYKENYKQPNFKMWSVPTQQQRNSDPEHCPELFYDSKEVLPTHLWLPAVQKAFAKYEAQASSTTQKSVADKVKAVMELLGQHICVRGKQFGISKQYITAYVQQCQQHVDTQGASMPELADTESEIHIFFSQKQQYSVRLNFC